MNRTLVLGIGLILFLGRPGDRAFSQEGESLSEGKQLMVQPPSQTGLTTTTIVEVQMPPVSGAKDTVGGSKPTREQEVQTGGRGAEGAEQGLSDRGKGEVEELKSRFRELVGEEMKRFGVLEESLPGEKDTSFREEKQAAEAEEVKPGMTTGGKVEAPPDVKRGEETEGGKEANEEVATGAYEEIPGEVSREGETEEAGEIPPPPPEKPREVSEKVALDFDDADIKEVITALADIMGVNYVIDPRVKGKVSIHTSGEISKKDIFPILETIFEVNDIAAVKVGDIYKIIPVKEAEKQPLLPQREKEVDTTSPDRVMLQIVPLRYVSTTEMEKVLKPFLGRGGDIVNFAHRNILVIVDTASNMEKLLSLIDTVDVSIFDNMYVRFYHLENAEAKDLAKELQDLTKALGMEETKGKKGGEILNFVPIERMNVILAVSSLPDVFGKVSEWIEVLDGVREELEEQIFIYFMENAKAVDIGDILSELYGERRREREKRTTTRTTRRETKAEKTPKQPKTPTRTGLETVTGEIKIVVDEVNNALIIRATPQDYAQILKTIKLLDTIPKQVLIEVLIAEVTLDENTEFGLEWSLATDYASLGGYKGKERVGQNLGLGGLGLDLAQPIAQSGFTYAFASQGLLAFLKAYARENRVDILSSPHILAADNTEAKIEVGKEVPIVTSEYTPTTLETGETYSRSIEYRDTGILLSVTPRINDKGLVAMEISQEVSDVSEQRIEGINSPVILKRQAETSLVVQNGGTIAIGGLIRDKRDVTKEGIPLLSKLPYLGRVFSYTKEVGEKTELLILITPHVVKTFEEAAMITEEFKEKVEGLKKMIGKRRGE